MANCQKRAKSFDFALRLSRHKSNFPEKPTFPLPRVPYFRILSGQNGLLIAAIALPFPYYI